MTEVGNGSGAQLAVSSLEKTFQSGDIPLPVLRGVDLTMSAGDQLAVTGPSGSGKSTLLYIIGTLDQPTGGTVSVNGEDPFARDATGLAEFRNSQVGFIFQDHHLLPQCTVLENVLVPLLASSGAATDDEERAMELLERVGLADRRGHLPARISGGERQRVAVCRALINRPALLLADEPTGNLDQKTADSVGSLLLDLSREQDAILVCVTHSLELASRFSRRGELCEGKLVEMGGEG